MKTFTFEISGMSCDHCVRALTKALESVEGVARTDVQVGHAEILAGDDTPRESLVEAIHEEGFEVVSG